MNTEDHVQAATAYLGRLSAVLDDDKETQQLYDSQFGTAELCNGAAVTFGAITIRVIGQESRSAAVAMAMTLSCAVDEQNLIAATAIIRPLLPPLFNANEDPFYGLTIEYQESVEIEILQAYDDLILSMITDIGQESPAEVIQEIKTKTLLAQAMHTDTNSDEE